MFLYQNPFQNFMVPFGEWYKYFRTLLGFLGFYERILVGVRHLMVSRLLILSIF